MNIIRYNPIFWLQKEGFWAILAVLTVLAIPSLLIESPMYIPCGVAIIIGLSFLWYFPESSIALLINGVIYISVILNVFGLQAGQWVTLLYMTAFVFACFIIWLKEPKFPNWQVWARILMLPLLIGMLMFISLLGSESPEYGSTKFFRYGTYQLAAIIGLIMVLTSRKRLRTLFIWIVLFGALIVFTSILTQRSEFGIFKRLTLSEDVNPIGFARNIGFGAITLLFFWDEEGKIWRNILIAIGLIIGLLFIILSGSRGPFLGYIAGLLAFLAIVSKKPQRFILMTFGLVALVLILLKLLPIELWLSRVSSVVANVSIVQRLTLWKQAIKLIGTHPVMGSGLGSFDAYIGYGVRWPHNIFLEIWSEIGILGIIIFLIFIFKGLRLGWLYRSDKDHFVRNVSCVGFAMAVFSLVISQFSGDLSFNFLIWFSISLLISLPFIPRENDSE
ncbi:MAG: O-antigen ligase family protein [Bacteroidetes bacterium]|nr:O-antigen ligase family protein [Bacteroidota bacterium]